MIPPESPNQEYPRSLVVVLKHNRILRVIQHGPLQDVEVQLLTNKGPPLSAFRNSETIPLNTFVFEHLGRAYLDLFLRTSDRGLQVLHADPLTSQEETPA